MVRIGLIKEGKIPADNRVALTPAQCKWIIKNDPRISIKVERSQSRCFIDEEYKRAGVELVNDLNDCDIILGIKEVPPAQLLKNKTYLFFSHTRKKQPYNQKLLQTILKNNCTLIDYECMEHEDGQRIIGFGFFAGIVGAHNGMMVYGKRTGSFKLDRVYKQKVMNLMGIIEVEKDEYIYKNFSYPVYVQLKGADLYVPKEVGKYSREDFHEHPAAYRCLFEDYIPHTDILMNGIFWDVNVPRLFETGDISKPNFRIQVIADVTDDSHGSVPINLGDQSIEDPVYGVDRKTFKKTAPYLPGSVDVMAVGNLPNELPRDASKYFGEQLLKYILPDLIEGNSAIIERATIVKNGRLTERFNYLKEYAEGTF
jgi:alanine dehydrogenase